MIAKRLPKAVTKDGKEYEVAIFMTKDEADAMCALFAKQSPDRLRGAIFKAGGWALTGAFYVLDKAGYSQLRGEKDIKRRFGE